MDWHNFLIFVFAVGGFLTFTLSITLYASDDIEGTTCIFIMALGVVMGGLAVGIGTS